MNTWVSLSILNFFKENLGYDDNGNILKYRRYGYKANFVMDSLNYTYNSGNNQLNWVKDFVSASLYGSDPGDVPDIDNQQVNNYTYDEIGNLIKDIDITGE